MDHPYNAWIAHFDLLGFKTKLRTTPVAFLQQEVREVVHDLLTEAGESAKNIGYLFYADTFIFYSKSSENYDYPGLIHAATHFMEKCISKGTALRGAIAYGEIVVSCDKRIVLGSAFLDSHQHCEDQDWLGLILTPAAADRLIRANLNPVRHGFRLGEIPRRKCTEPARTAYAYSFCRGFTKFPSPLLSKLREMQHFSPEDARVKYERTIQFIEKHSRMIESRSSADEEGKTAATVDEESHESQLSN